jgi:hypothetical protein
MSKVTWNEKAAQYLTPIQREAYANGQTPKRLEGKLYTDDAGRVWYGAGEHKKLVGDGARPTLADGAPAPEDAAQRDLDAPTGAPAKATKPRAKPKAKRSK